MIVTLENSSEVSHKDKCSLPYDSVPLLGISPTKWKHTSTQRPVRKCLWPFYLFIFKNLFTFRERRKEGEREGEKYQCVVASCPPPTVDLACNPGMCPGWELNRQPFGSQARAQSTELDHPGQEIIIFFFNKEPAYVNREYGVLYRQGCNCGWLWARPQVLAFLCICGNLQESWCAWYSR